MSTSTDDIDAATGPPDADDAWHALSRPQGEPTARFDDAEVADLPDPARRWLTRVVPAGVPTHGAVVLHMTGQLRLGPRWFDLRAEQILRPGVGFVWRPVVGGRVVRFTGADLLVGSEARMVFRLHGLVPVVDAAGEDVIRSAAGRLAGETVVWAPQALVPEAGARWVGVDADRARVIVPSAGHDIEVEITVDDDGILQSLCFDRWNASAKPPRPEPFGGPATDELVTARGVRISGAGSAGWGWRTASWPGGEFFRYRIVGCTMIP